MEQAPQILVVDDDARVRDMIRMWFSHEPWRVDFVATGVQGLDLLLSDRYDAAVLDLHLPAPTGMKILRVLRQCPVHTKVVVLTGYADLDTAVEAMQLGAVDFVKKPMEIERLRSAVLQALPQLTLPANALAERLDRRIEQNCTTPGFRLADLCRICSVSLRHARRALVDHFKDGFQGRLSHYRTRKAIRMIIATDTLLKVIATECGFCNPVQMARAVSEATGMAPHVLRQHLNRPDHGPYALECPIQTSDSV